MDFEVLTELVPIRGRTVIDVGCGDGALVKRLRAAGADVTGVDIDVERARAADPDGRYVTGRRRGAAARRRLGRRRDPHAQPAPRPDPDAALRELRRVVRDALYVAEPLPEGEYFELMRIVDDETEVLALAQAALARAAGFERVHTIEYEVTMRIDDFEEVRERVLAADPDRAERFAAVEDELRAQFRPGEYAPPMRADLLRVVRLP